MATLSRTAQAKLAAEIQSSLPSPEWDSIAELKKWKEKLTIKGKDETLTFDKMVAKYKDLDAEIKFREKAKETIKESIQAALLVAQAENDQLDNVLCEGYSVSLVTRQGSKKIVPEKLLEQGVSIQQITAATEIGPSSQYVSIRAVKDK